jgi:hypothetical protein
MQRPAQSQNKKTPTITVRNLQYKCKACSLLCTAQEHSHSRAVKTLAPAVTVVKQSWLTLAAWYYLTPALAETCLLQLSQALRTHGAVRLDCRPSQCSPNYTTLAQETGITGLKVGVNLHGLAPRHPLETGITSTTRKRGRAALPSTASTAQHSPAQKHPCSASWHPALRTAGRRPHLSMPSPPAAMWCWPMMHLWL